MLGAALAIGAAGSLIGSYLQYKGMKAAANTQAAASDRALQFQRQMYAASEKRLAPWVDLGTEAAARLKGGLTAEELQLDPGYLFRLSEGEKGINRAAGVTGSRYSGATLKALQRFGQDYASNEYGKAFQRELSLADLGRLAAANIAGVGGQVANASSNIVIGAGDNAAAAQIGGANVVGNAVGNLAGLPLQYELLKQAFPENPTG